MNNTTALVRFLSGLKFEDLPGEVVERSKACLLDYLGVSLAGSREPAARAALEAVEACGTSGEATLVGTQARQSPVLAAFFNAVAGHVLELDDGDRFAMGHPGVCVFPTVLAVAEVLRLSGRQVILGGVCGYEVFGRVGHAANPSHFGRGYHTTGTCGAMAAAVAGATAAGLDARKLAMALGLGASSAAGLMEFLSDGAMSKQYHAGHAAMTGALATFLAMAGFTAPESAIEGDNGFLKVAADKSEPSRLSAALGSRYRILDAYVKIHASCRHTHAPVDAVLSLIKKHSIKAEQIELIEVGVYKSALRFCGREITTGLSGKMSIPYAVAVAAVSGAAGTAQFESEWLNDRRVLDLMNRVKVTLDPEMESLLPEKRGARVCIRSEGREYRETIYWPKGEPENPVSREEVIDKFRTLATPVVGPDKAEAIVNEVDVLEETDSVQQLVAALRPCQVLSLR